MKLSKAIKGYEMSMLAEGYSQMTLERYHYCLKQWCKYLEDPDLSKITPEKLKEFSYWLRVEYKPNRPGGNDAPLATASLYTSWKAIRSFYNWASRELSVTRPDNNLPPPKYSSRVILPFTKEEILALLKACDYSFVNKSGERKAYKVKRHTAKRDRALLLTLLDTGIRVSECARLKVKDVNLESGEVIISPFGSGLKTKSRNVYLGKTARIAVWKYLSDRESNLPNDFLFLTKDSRSMNRHNIRSLCRRLGERAAIPNVHPHRFRHSFAIQYLRNGGDVFTLQRLLGHSTLSMVSKYLRLADTDSAEAHRRASPADRWNL